MINNRKKLYLIIVTSILFSYPAFADTINRVGTNDPNRVRAPITSTVPNPTGETNASKKNIGDWNRYFQSHGMNMGSIGNTNTMFANTSYGRVATGGDPTQLSNENISRNSSLTDVRAKDAFSRELMQDVVTKTLNNNRAYTVRKEAKTIKCYITRDIPYGYKCPVTGLIYSNIQYGNMDKTKKECEIACFRQLPCINLETNPTKKVENINFGTMNITLSTPVTKTINTDYTKIVENISFSDIINSKVPVYYKVVVRDIEGNEFTIVQDYDSRYGNVGNNREKNIFINKFCNSISITTYIKQEGNATVSIPNVVVNYKQVERWFCPDKQDVSNLKGGNFSNVCPSGNLVTLTATINGNTVSYLSCADAKGSDYNPDGTFTTYNSCKAFCKKTYQCVESIEEPINEEALKFWREGCMENTNCSNAGMSCANARLSPNVRILNEVVFDATQNSYKTIVDGSQVPGVERPRLLLDSSIKFEDRKKEETKDRAFKDMTDNKTFNITKQGIGMDTNASTAYGIYINSGTTYGAPNTISRSLTWKLKPKALDVNNKKKFYIYMVVIGNVEYRSYDPANISGNKDIINTANLVQDFGIHTITDEIWWIKTDLNSDSFKVFRRAEDKYKYGINVSNDKEIAELAIGANPGATPYKYETFSNNNWVPISETAFAEHVKIEDFNKTKMYYEYPVINEIKNMNNFMPGLASSTIVETKFGGGSLRRTKRIYGGAKDGSGDYIARFRTYALYSEDRLTYADIVQKIESGEVKPFYELGAENNYPKTIESDSSIKNHINIYLYGPADNASGFVDIKLPDDAKGKEGFIFVFID